MASGISMQICTRSPQTHPYNLPMGGVLHPPMPMSRTRLRATHYVICACVMFFVDFDLPPSCGDGTETSIGYVNCDGMRILVTSAANARPASFRRYAGVQSREVIGVFVHGAALFTGNWLSHERTRGRCWDSPHHQRIVKS
jgi:hypothetical protein